MRQTTRWYRRVVGRAFEIAAAGTDSAATAPRILLQEARGRRPAPADPRAMADALRAVLTDEERRRALGNSGRGIQRQALERGIIVDQYEQLYMSLVGRMHARNL